ncbi:hypothetical protein FJZ53_03780 [Candidatus Woesearchaeota archaeon]|nr:hypothetical protein [Candidatus Woesearchaeota archaeon]
MNKITRQGKTASMITLAFIILFMLTVINTYGDLNCQVDTASCTNSGTALLYLKNDTLGRDNAHAENTSEATYPQLLCCNSTNNPGVILNTCGTPFLNLSAVTNAHVQAPDYDPGYMLLFHFDNDSNYDINDTHAYDYSGYGNNGTVYGGANWTPDGRINGAFIFEGTNSYVQVADTGNGILNPSYISIEMWMKITGFTADYMDIIGKRPGTNDAGFVWELSNEDTVTSHYLHIGDWRNIAYNYTSFDTWYHVVTTYDGSNYRLYVNGAEVAGSPVVVSGTYTQTTNPLSIGAGAPIGTWPRYFNGTIDEVAIYNRSLSASEVLAHYQRGLPGILKYTNSACMAATGYTTTCNVTREASCEANYSCLLSMASSGADNLTDAHVSTCGVYDTKVCCSRPNSPPDNVSNEYFLEPYHGNATLFNRTLTFQWLNTTDPDSDPLTYNIQVKQCGTSNPATCNPDTVDFTSFTGEGEFNITGIAEGTNITEYISMVEAIADQNYTWRVRAYDGLEWGGWSENWTFYVPSTVMFTVFNKTMEFGSVSIGDVNDTSDNSPLPFRVRNDGNVLTDFNITVETSADWLWDTQQIVSPYFQYWIDNATAYESYAEENGSFNWSHSATLPTWFNLPLTNDSANIRQLNYSDIMDEAEIDIRIEVPPGESTGAKGSTVRITGWVAL